MAQETYGELRRLLQASDPRLKNSILDSPAPSSAVWKPWARAKVKVIALHLGTSNSFGSPVEYTDAPALAAHMRQAAACANQSSRSIYVLEGLSREFVDLFGHYFSLHPSLFMDHERLVPCGDRMTGENGGLPTLPSTIADKDHVAFKYHEPLTLSRCPTEFRCVCESSGRHIAITRLMGKFSNIGIARRKCTFWSKTMKDGGWTSLIICDPPIRRILTNYSGIVGSDVNTTPYDNGYIDFRSLSDQLKVPCGPPRTSLSEDILFYVQNNSDATDSTHPKFLRTFVEKVIASHYLKLARFLQTNVEVVQWQFSRKQDLASFDVSASEEQWSDIQAWERRIAEYQDDLEGIMLQLGIPLVQLTDFSHVHGSSDSRADFQYLMFRYGEIRQRVHTLAGAVTALASLAGNRAAFKTAELSLKEAERAGYNARSVKMLTILGVVFLPLSFSATLFSMADKYTPGSSNFWVYFAVSFPLLGLVVLAYSLAELGYTRGETRWSPRTAIVNLRRWFT
ncbi:Nn.00g095890.m01.CDS01 [Neocucurbitaria sp. VM-36]